MCSNTHTMRLRMEQMAQCRSRIPIFSTLTCVSLLRATLSSGQGILTDLEIDKFTDAFKELGMPFVEEPAFGNAMGAYFAPSDINPLEKTRSSSLYAYYDKVSHRTNLKLLSMHQARKILFETVSNSTTLIAVGVEAIDRTLNTTVQFTARMEVILAAGAVFTPQLLQWSGIGPRDVLEAAGIETKIDFPAVGSNFQDHAVSYLSWTCKSRPKFVIFYR